MATTVSAMFIPVHDPDAALGSTQTLWVSRFEPTSRTADFVGSPLALPARMWTSFSPSRTGADPKQRVMPCLALRDPRLLASRDLSVDHLGATFERCGLRAQKSCKNRPRSPGVRVSPRLPRPVGYLVRIAQA